MIGFIGLGAAGGNMVDEASLKGIPSVAINYSQKDLDSLEHVENRLKLLGSEGAGKNRDEAIRLMERNWERSINFVKEHLSSPSIEVIFVCFAAGGGSGSGIAPLLLDLLLNEMEDKTFVAVPILPEQSEAMVAQMNAIMASEELSKLGICVLPVDNQKVRDVKPQAGKSQLYKITNYCLVQSIIDLTSYTELESKSGILDQKDLRTIWDTKGTALISVVQNINASSDITRLIQDSWKHSIFVTPEYRNVMKAGIVLDGKKELLEKVQMRDIFDAFQDGMPAELFEGYYHFQEGLCFTVLSGMPWYRSRMRVMEDLYAEKQKMTEEWEKQESEYESSIKISRKPKSKPVGRKSAKDVLERYRR